MIYINVRRSAGGTLMAMLDGMLAEIGSERDVQAIAERVALPVAKVEEVIAALGVAHAQPGDAVETASASTGMPAWKVSQIMDLLGGRGSLSNLSCVLGVYPTLFTGQGA